MALEDDLLTLVSSNQLVLYPDHWRNYNNLYIKLNSILVNRHYSQWTINIMRLLTEGGIPLDAMQRYGPICCLLTRVIFKIGPSKLDTEIIKIKLLFNRILTHYTCSHGIPQLNHLYTFSAQNRGSLGNIYFINTFSL